VVRVRLTDEGRRAGAAVERFSRRINQAMIASLDPVERLLLPNGLRKLVGALDAERDD